MLGKSGWLQPECKGLAEGEMKGGGVAGWWRGAAPGESWETMT